MSDKNIQHNYIKLADTVRLARIAIGVSQRQLSNILDMSPAYTSHLESGRIQPNTKTLWKISHTLKLSYSHLAYLAGYTDIDSNENPHISELNNLAEFTESEWEALLDYARYLLSRRHKTDIDI